MRRRPFAACACCALVAASVVGCGSGKADEPASTTAGSVAPVVGSQLRAALARAVDWSVAHQDGTDAFTLVLFDFLGRRYGIDAFSGARARARQATAGADPANEPELRLVRPDARPSAASLRGPGSDASRLVRGALACDEPGAPSGFEQTMRDAVGEGGYALTHAAVAQRIERDLGCAPTGGPELRDRTEDALAAAVARDTRVDDVAVERLAMLALVGAGARIPNARVRSLLDAQQRDGGWAGTDVATRAHTTALAIWVLADRLGERGDPAAGLALRD